MIKICKLNFCLLICLLSFLIMNTKIFSLSLVLFISACQNGVIDTPIGQFGILEKNEHEIRIGFHQASKRNKKIKTVPLPQAFHGTWASTEDAQQEKFLCKVYYGSEDYAELVIDAAKGHILWRGLEWGGDWYVLEITKQSATEVSGMMYLEFSEPGMEEPAVSKKPFTLRIKNKRLFLSGKIPMAGEHKKGWKYCSQKVKF